MPGSLMRRSVGCMGQTSAHPATSSATAAATAARKRGRAVRKRVPRSAHAVWDLRHSDDRDPLEILQAQAEARVPELVPIRYGRMLASAFAFYRGAAAIMADDLATTPTTGLTVQLCGDAHLANFGGFSAPDRTMVFDLNDFDETLPGPFEWDIKRLVASFAVASRDRGFSGTMSRRLTSDVVTSYRDAIADFAGMSRLDVWYTRLDADDLEQRWVAALDASTLARFHKNLAKARRKTSRRAFSRYTTTGPDGMLRPVSDPPFVVPLDELVDGTELEQARAMVADFFDRYLSSLPDDKQFLLRGYRLVGAARKVVGVGSVGTRCWILLLVGEHDSMDDLVLQIKEAVPSVLEPYLGTSVYPSHGRRVVEGQRVMQAASDTLLGWEQVTHPTGEVYDYYVRQMWDGKASARLDTLSPDGYEAYAQICGWTLARAHARSGDRKAIAGYLGSGGNMASAMADFAEAYADQNEADYQRVRAAADDGLIPVASG
jgi:uncharacterized protein (DUF2252 family)